MPSLFTEDVENYFSYCNQISINWHYLHGKIKFSVKSKHSFVLTSTLKQFIPIIINIKLSVIWLNKYLNKYLLLLIDEHKRYLIQKQEIIGSINLFNIKF